MNNKIDDSTILNFLKGRYSYNEYLKVKKWFDTAGDDDAVKELLVSQWDEINAKKEGDNESLNNIFQKIQYTILLDEKNNSEKKVFWRFYRQVAAILLIPVLIFSFWFNMNSDFGFKSSSTSMSQQLIEVEAPEGSRVNFLLPDSSEVWLNSGSKLEYPPVFQSKREVILTGEAYFEVKHLEKSAFTVSVKDMDVEVLGTKFNVSAYDDDPFSYVVLNEGKVEVNGKVGVFNRTLLPNEKITFDRKGETLKLEDVNAHSYSAWKDGLLVLDNETLEDVALRLERWYNAEIIIQDEVLKKYRFKATFRDEPLEEVLKLIGKTTAITYEIERRTINKNGVLTKRKVQMKMR